jgi:hypothetical protein
MQTAALTFRVRLFRLYGRVVDQHSRYRKRKWKVCIIALDFVS